MAATAPSIVQFWLRNAVRAKVDLMRVVVVEDGDSARGALREYLTRGGHEVVEAPTVAELWRAIEGAPPEGAILDVLLPDGSGLDLIEPLLEHNDQMRIVILTGFPSWQTACYALRLGATEYLAKPPTFSDLDLALAGTPRRPEFEFQRPTWHEYRYEHMMAILAESHGNRTLAAKKMGVPRQTLQRWLREGPPARRRKAARRKK